VADVLGLGVRFASNPVCVCVCVCLLFMRCVMYLKRPSVLAPWRGWGGVGGGGGGGVFS